MNSKIKTGSLASLASKVQDENNKTSKEIINSGDVLLDLRSIASLAREYGERKEKIVAIYISPEVKKSLEKIKLLDDFENQTTASIASAIISSFLAKNEGEIKEQFKKLF